MKARHRNFRIGIVLAAVLFDLGLPASGAVGGTNHVCITLRVSPEAP